MLNFTYEVTTHHLDEVWTGSKSVPTVLLISTSWFLVLAYTILNGSVIACSTACSSAAEMNEMSEYEIFPNWPRRQGIVAQQFELKQ